MGPGGSSSPRRSCPLLVCQLSKQVAFEFKYILIMGHGQAILLQSPLPTKQIEVNEETESPQIVAILNVLMGGAAQPALECVLGLNFHTLGAFVYFVPDDFAASADNHFKRGLRKLLIQNLSIFKIVFNEDFGVVVRAFAPFLAVPVHVIPAQLPHNMLLLAEIASQAEPHVEIRTAFIYMPIRAMLPPFAFLLHEVQAYFEVVAEIAPFPVRAEIIVLEFLAGFDFGFIVRVRTAVALLALAMDEFFAHAVGGELGIVAGSGGGDCWFVVSAGLRVHVVIAINCPILLLLLFGRLAGVQVGVSHGYSLKQSGLQQMGR